MTTASFSKINGRYCGFCVSGHSGYDEEGFDIVCSAISSAVYLTANNLIEIYGANADFEVKDGKLRLYAKPVDDSVHDAIDGLYIHLSQLAFQYPEFLKVCTVSFAG